MRAARSILTIAFVIVAQQVWGQNSSMLAVEAILANPKVVKTLDDIKADDARAFEEQKRITEIPAPPYKEKIRAEYFQKRMQELGFKDAAIDGLVRTLCGRITRQWKPEGLDCELCFPGIEA